MVHSYVNSAVTMFMLVTVDINLWHACKKFINNTQHEVERHPGPDIYMPDWLAAGRIVALTFHMNRQPSTFWTATTEAKTTDIIPHLSYQKAAIKKLRHYGIYIVIY